MADELPDLTMDAPAPGLVPSTPDEFEMATRRAREQQIAQAREGLQKQYGPPQPVAQQPIEQLAAVGNEQQARLGAVEQALLEKRQVSAPNPMYGPTKEFISNTKDALQAEREQTAAAVEFGRLRDVQLAQAHDMEVREAATELSVMKAKENLYQQEKEQVFNAQKQIQDTMQDVSRQIQASPDIDPNRYWADKSAGFKFVAALAAGLRGFSGDRNAMSHIENAIHRDIEAQKESFSQRVVSANVVGQRASMANNLFAQVMEKVQDERAAEMVLENIRLEQAKRQIEAQSMQLGTPIAQANGQTMLAHLDQKMEQNKLQLASMAAANPKRFTRTVHVLSGPDRELGMNRHASELKIAEQTAGEMAKAIGEGASREQERQDKYLSGEHGLYSRREKFGRDVAKVAPFKTLAERFKKHLQEGGRAKLSLEAARLKEPLKEAFLRMVSGAALSEADLERADALVESWNADWSLDKLEKMMPFADSIIDNARRSQGEDAAAAYFRTSEDKLPSIGSGSLYSGIGGSPEGSSVVDMD